MKKVMGKVRQTLSILLAVAMVVTCVPQTGLSALAANETPEITTTAETDAAQVNVTTPEDDPEVTDDAQAEEVTEEGNNEEETTEGGEEQAPAADDETVVDDDETTESAEDAEPAEDVEEPTIDVMETGDSHTVELPTDPQGYTINGDTSAIEGTDYSFTVTAAAHYQIDSVKYTIGGVEKEFDDLTGTYTIPGDEITGDVTIAVTASKIQRTITVTVDTPANATVTYSITDGTQDQSVTSGTPVTVGDGDQVQLKVVPAADYDAVVTKDDTAITGTDNVYDLGEITANVSIAVTTTKNKFAVATQITKVNDQEQAAIAYVDDCVDTESDKIAKGTALKFKVNAVDGVDLTGKKVAVSYKIGTDGTETPLTAEEDVYTIAAAEITDDVTLIVTVRELTQYAVSLKANENITAQYYDAAAEKYEDFTAAVQVNEDSEFKFTVDAKDYFKITKVMAGDEKLTADEDGVYSFEVTAATEIDVTTELDEAQCKSLTFKVSGDAGSATAALSVSANDIGGLDGKEVEADKAVAIPSDKITLVITPKAGYNITKVDGNDATPDAQGVVTEEVEFGDAKEKTVTVTTDAAASVSENTISFANNAPHMSYKVTGDTKVSSVADSADTYKAAVGAQRLQFTITATGSYKPVVTRTAAKAEDAEEDPTPVPVEPSKTTTTKTGATYEYVVAASQLTDGETFTIEETEDTREVTIDGVENATIVASVDGKKRNPDADSENKKYTVRLNDVVTFQISAVENCSLTAVTSKIGETGKVTSAKIANGVATIEVKVTDDTTIAITTKDLYVASKLQEKGHDLTVVDAKKNSYNVSYDGTYTANVRKGKALTDVELSEVKVLLGKNDVKAAAEGATVGSIAGNVATIDLSKADTAAIAGKTLTVELYAKEGTGDEAKDEKVASYSLVVSVPAKDIKIDKKAELKVNQTIDTVKTYKVTAAKGVDLSRLDVREVGNSGIIEDVSWTSSEGELEITTAAKAPADVKATIEVVDASGKAEDGTISEDAAKATIEITPVALISASTKAPAVKLVAATDVSFKLSLSAKTETAASGNLYYKVDTVQTLSGNDLEATKKTTYIEKDGDSQNAIVKVSDSALGAGGAASYTVSASVVHASEAVVNNTLASENVLGESAASKAQTLKTQEPAYEDKLSLTKRTTTVITGQKDVVVAEPKFNKYTTFASLAETNAVKDLSYTGSSALTLTTEEDALGNCKIVASATANTAIGKHKIQVTAAAENGAYASVATLDVTVVRGIHDLGVSVPSTNLYKAVKKAAKVKATAVFNNGWTGNWVPKNKSVTWDIVDVNFNELETNDPLKTMVKMSKGTVTVDKNFIIDPEDDEQHQFRIKVTADNSKKFAGEESNGEPVVGYSDIITITSTGEDIKTVAIVKEDEQSGKYIVAAMPTGTKEACAVEATAINYGTVVAFTSEAKGLAMGKEYTEAELAAVTIDSDLLTLKSSSPKNVSFYSDDYIEVNKVGKVKLTATANDGSKNKAELSLNIINDKTTDKTLGLRVYGAAYETYFEEEYNYGSSWVQADWDNQLYNPDTDADPKNISFDGSTMPVVALQVQQKGANDSSYSTAPDFANFTLSVTGGKIVEQWGTEAHVAVSAPTVTVKLTDASVSPKVVTEYVLKSTGSQEKPSFKVLNKLHSWAIVEEQKAEIQVNGLTAETLATEGLVARVEVDWSAKTAKNESDLAYLAEKLQDSYAVTVADDKAGFTLGFAGDDGDWVILNQKNYKLKVTLGTNTTVDNRTTFTAKTLPVVMTVNVEKAKAFGFTPTTSYKLTTKDASSVLLAGKAKGVGADEWDVEWLGLQNMNTKGVTNNFTDYFKISDDGKSIVLKDGSVPAAADQSGYVTYEAYSTKSYYSNSYISNTVKITVKVDESKTTATYSQSTSGSSAVEIGNTTGQSAIVNILAKVGKVGDWADLSKVIVDPRDANKQNFTAEVTGDSGGIKLTYIGTEPLKKGKLTVKLLVVPTASYYIDNNTIQWSVDEAYQTYGIPVSVKLTVGDPKNPIDTAVSAVEDWVRSIQNAETSPVWLDSEATAESIKAAMKTAIEEVVSSIDGAAIEIEGVTLTPAQDDTPATVTGTIKVTVGEAEDTVAFTFVIPEAEEEEPDDPNPQTPAASSFEQAIKNAVADATITTLGYTPADSESGTAASISNAADVKTSIEGAISSASINGLDAFTVTAASEITITKDPTATETGTATIKVTVTHSTDSSNTAEFTIELEIPVIEEEEPDAP